MSNYDQGGCGRLLHPRRHLCDTRQCSGASDALRAKAHLRAPQAVVARFSTRRGQTTTT